jgi:polysaccharide biosynthesis/export protein
MNKTNKLLTFLGAALIAVSCSTPKNIPYFQDVVDGSVDSIAVSHTITMRPGDKISIIVNSKNQKIAAMFNLSYATRYMGMVSDDVLSSQNTGVQGYMVEEDGTIDFPVIGRIQVAGLTRDEISRLIKEKLISGGLVQDPVVTVEYLNLKVSVLGEVTKPGRVSIDRDTYTIMDALSAAGDLTIYGMRESVRVIRAENGVRKTYVVNLCSAQNLYSSPVYYLQQNDVIYVEPNDVRVRQSTVNGNNVRSTSFWVSIASLLATVTNTVVLVMNYVK